MSNTLSHACALLSQVTFWLDASVRDHAEWMEQDEAALDAWPQDESDARSEAVAVSLATVDRWRDLTEITKRLARDLAAVEHMVRELQRPGLTPAEKLAETRERVAA